MLFALSLISGHDYSFALGNNIQAFKYFIDVTSISKISKSCTSTSNTFQINNLVVIGLLIGSLTSPDLIIPWSLIEIQQPQNSLIQTPLFISLYDYFQNDRNALIHFSIRLPPESLIYFFSRITLCLLSYFFSSTWSCSSLPRPTTSTSWKLLIFV